MVSLAPTRRALPRWTTGRLSAGALAVAVVVSLVIGSGAFASQPASLAQRAGSLESAIRCPSCEDISVGQSQSSAAVAARHQISSMLAQGDSDSQIEQYFVSRYGPSILLSPPSRGLDLIVWVVPSMAAAAGIVGLATLFMRRHRALKQWTDPGH
ncbi:MAG: cytochrome c-type biogenesis protein [Acidimicrobiales bacterium]